MLSQITRGHARFGLTHVERTVVGASTQPKFIPDRWSRRVNRVEARDSQIVASPRALNRHHWTHQRGNHRKEIGYLWALLEQSAANVENMRHAVRNLSFALPPPWIVLPKSAVSVDHHVIATDATHGAPRVLRRCHRLGV
jgi:hypothetical protein